MGITRLLLKLRADVGTCIAYMYGDQKIGGGTFFCLLSKSQPQRLLFEMLLPFKTHQCLITIVITMPIMAMALPGVLVSHLSSSLSSKPLMYLLIQPPPAERAHPFKGAIMMMMVYMVKLRTRHMLLIIMCQLNLSSIPNDTLHAEDMPHQDAILCTLHKKGYIVDK